MKLITDIYRSVNKEGMYLYVAKGFDLEELPPALRKQFGRAELAMSLVLTPEKKLARAESTAVINAIQEQGFYLQMPPVVVGESYMQQIPNAKL
ncbi:hypothetical protein P886_4086 [Alteromonadaceae bacterium 2753L.S.0a.02]|nr:hypothetical protein P886_4086 [Alteromonadaceae bacterium 2753L.S.0a.02]